jgi:hypothetical protein
MQKQAVPGVLTMRINAAFRTGACKGSSWQEGPILDWKR